MALKLVTHRETLLLPLGVCVCARVRACVVVWQLAVSEKFNNVVYDLHAK